MNKKILKVAAKFERILTKKARDPHDPLNWSMDEFTHQSGGKSWAPVRPDFDSTYEGPVERGEEIYDSMPGGELGKSLGKDWDIKKNDPVASKKYPFQVLTTFINAMKLYIEQDNRATFAPTLKKAYVALKNAIYKAAQKEMVAPNANKSQLKAEILPLYSNFFAQVNGMASDKEKQVMLGNCFEIKRVLDSIPSAPMKATPTPAPKKESPYKPSAPVLRPAPQPRETPYGNAKPTEPKQEPFPRRTTVLDKDK